MDLRYREGDNESHLDSHADTCAGGSNFILLDRPDQVTKYVDVAPFSDEYEPMKDVPIATCATAWTSPETGTTYILVFHQMLYLGNKIAQSLLCPNQMRDYGVVVEDTPSFFDPTSKHGITVSSDDGSDTLFIPLRMSGVFSVMDNRAPTQDELYRCKHFVMTSDKPWDPYSDRFQDRKRSLDGFRFQDSGDCFSSLRILDSVRNISLCSTSINAKIYRYLVPDDTRGLSAAHKSTSVAHNSSRWVPETRQPRKPNRKERPRKRMRKDPMDGLPLDFGYDNDAEALERKVSWGPTSIVPSRTRGLTPDILSKRWGISMDKAKATIKVTTQRGIRNLENPLVRRMKTQSWQNKKRLNGKWYSDTMHFTEPSILRQDKAAQVFTNAKGYDEFIPILKESTCSDGLVQFINDVGVPDQLVVDGARAQGSHETYNTSWRSVLRSNQIHQTFIQPHCWWQNAAERTIAELRKEMRRLQSKKHSPPRLWGFLGQYVAGKRQRTASSIPSNQGRTPFEVVHGYTPDISLYAVHDWYDFVWWYDQFDKTPKLGRWLGPAHRTFGGGDCFYVITKTGRVHVTNSISYLKPDDWKDRDVVRQMGAIDVEINRLLGNSGHSDQGGATMDVLPDPVGVDPDEELELEPAEPEAMMPDADDYDPEEYDNYIGTEVLLPQGSEQLRGIVKRRHRDPDGNLYGKGNSNPILDTRRYEVQMPDGSVEVYGANIIAESIMANVDDEGNLFVLMDEILDHQSSDEAVKIKDGTFITKSGTRRDKRTTKGWKLLVSWKDGTTSWVRLADMKESFPVEVAEYAKAAKIIDEPAFKWWCYKVLRKKSRLISGAKTKYWLKTHKYGIRLPKTIQEALRIDRETGTDFWAKAIAKEMKNVMVAFEFDESDKIPVGHQKISVHMVFDVKITLQRKARLVADGHKVPETSKENTYSSVPSRDSVRLFFLIAALNDLDILSADIQNAYLTAPLNNSKCRYYVVACEAYGFPKEFWGRPAKVVRALYGLPVAGASFRSHLARHLRELGYRPSKADPDVHLRPAVKENGDLYYQMMIAYVDDLLCCGVDPRTQMQMVADEFTLKDGTVEEPTLYLGADIEKVVIPESDDPGKTRWAMSSTNYTKKAVAEVERELGTAAYGYTYLPKGVKTPLSSDYRPELDPTPELDDKKQNYYQGLVGILRWICELGRLDIIMPVSLMSRYLAQAREGHLNQIFHVFAYLKHHERSKLVFDDTLPQYDEARFHKCDWSEFYPDAEEVLPPDMPEPRGKSVVMTCFVDADHAGCKETRRSHTGVLIFVNRAPILWFSKRQSTVETSTFGSEIVALRIAIEMIQGLRYKLRMFGVPIDGPCDTFCDNESVVKNVSRPESPLKKKHNAIAYHKARESIAAGILRIATEDGKTNIADILTKLLKGPTLRALSARCMW